MFVGWMYCLDASALSVQAIIRSSLCRSLMLRRQQLMMAKLRDVAINVEFGINCLFNRLLCVYIYQTKYPCSKPYSYENNTIGVASVKSPCSNE